MPDETSIMSLGSYQALVDKCASERLDHPIANGSALHAKILISKLFEIAKSEVLLISGSLRIANEAGIEIYGFDSVIKNALSFLAKPNTKFSVIVQTGAIDKDNKNRFLSALIDDEKRKGSIDLLVPPKSIFDFSVPHFMVSDGSAYRLETGEDAHTKLSANSITAVANFGDKQTAKDLKEYFSELAQFLVKEKGVEVQSHASELKAIA